MNDTEPERSSQQCPPREHLNDNIRGLEPSATLAINEHCAALQRAGRRVYRLGLGQSPFPVPEFLAQALREHAGEKDYLAVKGLAALREAIAGFLQRTEGLDYDPDHILVGPGTKELMFLAQLVYCGDLVVPSPSWVSYAPQARILGRPIRWLATQPTSGSGLTPQALDELCRGEPQRPRLLILNNPDNPTGLAYEGDQLQPLAEVARRYRMLVLSDEIYSATRFDGEHVSIARFYPEGTIVSNGLSKWCGAGGWRLGALAFPSTLRWLVDAMAAVASETYTTTSAPIQYAAVSAFQGGPALDAYLDHSQQVLRGLAGHFHTALTGVGVELAPARGGFYLFIRFEALRERLQRRGIRTGEQLCSRLLEDTGVALLPGGVFGRPSEELSARLAYVDFDGAAALASLNAGEAVDEVFLDRYCERLVDAAQRMAQWLEV